MTLGNLATKATPSGAPPLFHRTHRWTIRARCEDCGHERLIPFSCKGRGICPSCNARRMCEVAAQLGAVSYFRRHGLLDELDAAGMLTWQGSGGFSVDASVRIEAEDRAGIERLVRSCVPPAAPR